MLNLDSEGTRVFLFLLAVGIVVTIVLVWPKFIFQFNRLQNIYQLPSSHFREKLFLFFIHFMLIYGIYRLFRELWVNLYFYCLSSFHENQSDFFKHPLQWLPWVFVAVSLVGLVIFESGLKLIFINLWKKYRNQTPEFLLSSFGLVFLVGRIIYLFFTMILALKSAGKYLEQVSPNFSWRGFIYLFAYILTTVIFVGLKVLGNFALLKRLKPFFRPNFFYYSANLVVSCIEGISFCVKAHRGYFHHSSEFFFWFDKLFANYYLIPTCYLGFAWLLYQWSWFEKAKVENDPKLPAVMNLEKFWWWANGILAAVLLFDLVEDFGGLFWGPGSAKSVIN